MEGEFDGAFHRHIGAWLLNGFQAPSMVSEDFGFGYRHIVGRRIMEFH